MGSVHHPTYTKPLPQGAELFTRNNERYARWTDRYGHKRTAKVTTGRDGSTRIMLTGKHTIAVYRDGAGQRATVSTGCRTADSSRAMLVDLETRAEKVRSGKWTAAEDAVLDHQNTPIGDHVAAYITHLKGKRGKGAKRHISPIHLQNVEKRVAVIVEECQFKLLRNMNRAAMEKWIKDRSEAENPLAARTINAHAAALCAFGNWCVMTGRVIGNPFARPPNLNEQADKRHQRRALNDDELRQLLRIARFRPLAEYGRESVAMATADKPTNKRSRKTWTKAPLTLATLDAATTNARKILKDRSAMIAALEHVGRERALIYKTLVLTGLRKGELASLTVGQMKFAGPVAYALLAAADEKAGRGADVPLRGDLAADLKEWIADRLEAARTEARDKGGAIPASLPPDAPLFAVPKALSKIMNRDLAAAGIPKRDERNRVVDVHALRHTFGTMLSRGNVAPRTAQAAMRHGSIDLTMNVYTDPKLLDVAGAMDTLPSLPLIRNPRAQQHKATGTGSRRLVTGLVTTVGNGSTKLTKAGKPAVSDTGRKSAEYPEKSSRNQSLTTSDVMTGEGVDLSLGLREKRFQYR